MESDFTTKDVTGLPEEVGITERRLKELADSLEEEERKLIKVLPLINWFSTSQCVGVACLKRPQFYQTLANINLKAMKYGLIAPGDSIHEQTPMPEELHYRLKDEFKQLKDIVSKF